MDKAAKIILADDEDLFRKGILYLLKEHGFDIIFEASNGTELVDYLQQHTHHPDVILMDIKMPGLNGVEATKQIAQLFPEIKIIALSSYISPTFITNMLQVGAVSYIPKNASPHEMITTINQVNETGYYYNALMRQHISLDKLKAAQNAKSFFDDNLLTKRETEVLQLICRQKSAAEIAEILELSPRTVEGHRNNLLIKTDSKNVAGLVIFAIRNNFIALDDTLDF
jgi:DNA-binding NarL/FixJ family response regulator